MGEKWFGSELGGAGGERHGGTRSEIRGRVVIARNAGAIYSYPLSLGGLRIAVCGASASAVWSIGGFGHPS